MTGESIWMICKVAGVGLFMGDIVGTFAGRFVAHAKSGAPVVGMRLIRWLALIGKTLGVHECTAS